MKKQWSFVLMTTAVFALGVIGVTRAWAQDGVIAFLDLCNMESRAYVMRGQAESASNPRVLLSVDQFLGAPLDISTTGPVTVLLQGSFAVGPLAVQVNEDTAGNLVPEAPVSIRLPAMIPNLPPNVNTSSFVRFSPLGDRVAIVTSGGFLVIADIVRDVNDKVTGLTNPTVAANLLTIGSPSDSNLSSGPPANFPDFLPNGTQNRRDHPLRPLAAHLGHRWAHRRLLRAADADVWRFRVAGCRFSRWEQDRLCRCNEQREGGPRFA